MEVLAKNEGLITQIIGPVIDVEFQQGELPNIYDALKIYKMTVLTWLPKFNKCWAQTE